MKKLSYKTLAEVSYKGYLLPDAPERILQFGEGNFLRGFVNHFVDVLNEQTCFNSKVVTVQPIAQGLSEMINDQEGLYTLYLRGYKDGEKVNEKRVISNISRCLNPYTQYDEVLACADNPELRIITSNTTEAGIQFDPSCELTDDPPSSFPAKLTQFMYRRFQSFGAHKGKGFILLACELIDDNGKELESCVLRYARHWKLEDTFITWIQEENVFCSTLVDRIVTGYPRQEAHILCEELGYHDQLLDTAEIFGLWVIEGPEWIKEVFPVDMTKLPIVITHDHKPYKARKVRILNGAHTTFVLAAYLAGQNIVRDCMEDEVILRFMKKTIFDEIIPTLDLAYEELVEFAESVIDRFKNPFIDHELLSIALNSTSKWRARVLPSLKQYVARTGDIPQCICVSFASYIAFYQGVELTEHGLKAYRGDEVYYIKDDQPVLEFFASMKDKTEEELVASVIRETSFWGEDLSAIPEFEANVLQALKHIKEYGAYSLMQDATIN